MAHRLHFRWPVNATGIHRVIEQHAVSLADRPALVEGERSLTYRELNRAGNAFARQLMAQGLRRGSHAWVHMPRGVELAEVLLGILKAGASYTWIDPDRTDSPFPQGIAIEVGAKHGEERYLHVDAAALLRAASGTSSPNLPVVTRGTDIACILREGGGAPLILVPHQALTALRHFQLPQPAAWTGEPGALDLWLALMTGATAVVERKTIDIAA